MLLPKMGKIPTFHRRRKVDWLGGLLLMASAVVFMLVLTWGGNRYSWLSPVITAMIGAAVALALAFVMHARRSDEPFLPLPLMGGSVVPYAMAAGGCALGAMLGLTVHMPLYYEAVYHLSASESGLALIPLAAVSTGGAAIAGKAMARMKHYKRVAIIGTAFAAGIAGAARRCDADAAMGAAGRAVAVRVRARHHLSDQRGLDPEFGAPLPGRHHHRRAELFPRADGVVHGGGVHRDSADGAGRRGVARRRTAQRGGRHRGRRHGRGVPLRVRGGGGADGWATLLMVLMEEKPLAGPASVPAEMAE